MNPRRGVRKRPYPPFCLLRFVQAADVGQQVGVEGMAGQRGRFAQDDKLHAGTGDGYVHAAQVAEESYLPLVVGADEGDEDDVALLPLEAVDGVRREQVSDGAQDGALADAAAQVLHLGTVGRDDAEVDALVADAVGADAGDVGFEVADEQVGLVAVDASESVAHELLFEVEARGVYPVDGCVEVEDAAVADRGVGLEHAVVEAAGGELHDGFVHAVLHPEEADGLGLGLRQALHEGAFQSAAGGFGALDGGGQLLVVAGQDDAVGAADGYPAGGLEGLGGLVDEEGAEAPSVQQAVVGAYEGGGDDVRRVEEVGVYLHLEGGGAVAQAAEAVAQGLASGIVRAAGAALEGTELAADGPELRVGGVRLEAAFVGEGQHLVVDARGVADAQDGEAAVDEALRYPVDGGVALRADQHLGFAVEGLVDGLDQRRGLARAGRAVDDGHVAGAEHAVDGGLLRGVEPRQAHGVELAEAGLLCAQQQVAQLGQAVATGAGHVGQGFEHGAVGGLVEEQLHTHGVGALHVEHGVHAGHDEDHARVVGVGHGGLEGVVGYLPVGRLAEEYDGAAELEAVLDVRVARALDLQHQLVERVVVVAPHADGPPAQATLHLACHAHRLGLPPELGLLVLILHAQEQLLALDVRSGALDVCLRFHAAKLRISAKILPHPLAYSGRMCIFALVDSVENATRRG